MVSFTVNFEGSRTINLEVSFAINLEVSFAINLEGSFSHDSEMVRTQNVHAVVHRMTGWASSLEKLHGEPAEWRDRHSGQAGG